MRLVGRGLGSSPGIGGDLSHMRVPSRRAAKVSEWGAWWCRGDRRAGSVGEDRPGSAMATALDAFLSLSRSLLLPFWVRRAGVGGQALAGGLLAAPMPWPEAVSTVFFCSSSSLNKRCRNGVHR